MAFAPGGPIRIEMTKWGDRPHWQIPGVWLGSDRHGDWIGIPGGTRMVRPGAEATFAHHQVGLVPPAGSDLDRAFLATFHAPHWHVRIYVDMTTPPVWDGSTLRAVDLDLDVVRGRDGDVVVDDEDEFAEHQVELGYPADIVALAEASRDRVLRAVLEEQPPYDGSHEPWLAQLAQLVEPHP
jgi:uncharacterized protein